MKGNAPPPAQSAADPGFRWVIGTPYFVQGTSSLVEVPTLYFIKFALGMGDAGGQLFDSLRNGGWFVKPLWGYISDRFPLFGYRRKSWYILMALLAVLFWTANGLLIFAGVRIPAVYLLTFNMAFATYAFVDVVCDALMVVRGREERQVGSLINFQWTVLALANAGAVFIGGWLQGRVEAGAVPLSLVFFATGIPPLFTAFIGWRHIRERQVPKDECVAGERAVRRGRGKAPEPGSRNSRQTSRTLLLLALFIFFWRFSPSVGYIERSYLIDVRGFEPASFGTILAVGSVTFLLSIVAYRWAVRRFRLPWHQYLYTMVGIGALSFPLSFFLYLDPGHPWWEWLYRFIPEEINPVPGWNRYEWFRLLTQNVLGFATIPAFIIPLTLAGETVNLERAGTGYAFLMALSNVTNMFEGAVGAALFKLLSRPEAARLIEAFRGSLLDIAGVADERTLILQIFVYISLFFTLLTIPFIVLLKRDLEKRGIAIDLAGRRPDSQRH